MAYDSFIGARAPKFDDRVWDCQCARCGSSVVSEECWECFGEGYFELSGDNPDATELCDVCDGTGGLLVCCSSEEWCAEHPLPGRPEEARGLFEWFAIPEAAS